MKIDLQNPALQVLMLKRLTKEVEEMTIANFALDEIGNALLAENAALIQTNNDLAQANASMREQNSKLAKLLESRPKQKAKI